MNKKMRGYKVFNPDWKCYGMQYEVGRTYKHKGNLSLCESGFHFCEKLIDCFNYYQFNPNNKVAEIKAIGKIVNGDNKSVTDNISIIKEISWQNVLELVNLGTENTGLGNSGDRNSGDGNSGYRNSGDGNSGDRNSGYRNSGDGNSGGGNGCNYETGFFNSKEGTIRIFNKDSGLSRDEFYQKFTIPSCLYFDLTEWIDSENMTDKEKENNPKYETTEGYLKTLTYKEASVKSISKATDEEKEQIRALPNYDPDIFEEIFGIRI